MEHSMEDYEEYEEYEDDDQMDEEEEEYEEEVEDRKPTKEEIEYLELRQRLKEKIRRQSKRDGGSHVKSNDKKKLPYDNFGSFFGPSQPVISQRVIQESKSLLENQHLASRVSDHVHDNRKSQGSNSGAASKPRAPPKVVNEKKTKVQKLKDTRDYSFLFSEDTHVPAPSKESSRSVFAPSTEARSASAPMKSKQPLGNPRSNIHVGHKDKKSVPMNGQMLSKSKSASSGNLNLSAMKAKKQLGTSNNGNGPGRPMGNSNNGNGPGRPMGNSNNGHGPGRPVGNSNKGNGPGRPMVAPKTPSVLMQKKPSLSGTITKNSVSGVHKPLPSRKLEDKRNEVRPPAKAKVAPNRPMSSSRPQMSKPPPQRQVSSRPALSDQRPKKRPARPFSDDEDEDVQAISLIRKMFRYNPSRFSGDDDDSDMEANFDDIMMEEKRSEQIARKEDEEQLRLIQEEEERERRARIKRLKRAKGSS